MKYILCFFESGYSGNFYQEVNSEGVVVRMLDVDGNLINIPMGAGEENFIPYCASVVDPNPPILPWMQV